ncbi:MAG: PEP-CTERM sorting domain-containing protein [Phycisphaeraceae bacterium]
MALYLFAIVAAAPVAAPAQGQSFTAQQFYNGVIANGNLNQEAGELWAWHASNSMGQFVDAYLAYDDISFLQYGVQYFDYVVGEMRQAPDGYRGWIGPLPGDGARTDEHIGDAILFRHLLEFSELVFNDPVLNVSWGNKAFEYVQLAQTHLFEKWDARDTYHQVGDVGFYEWWDQQLPEDLSVWQPNPSRHNSSVTQQFNKQTAMGLNALRLYRITGDEQYQQRAFELFAFLKSNMQLYQDAYVWNFRNPALREDIRSVHFNDVKTWMAVHPNSPGYQATEVSDIIEAFHTGVVFDETDIQRLLNTQLEAMWNGNTGNPSFTGPDRLVNGGSTGTPGTIWGSLADFDDLMRVLVTNNGQGGGMRGEIIYDYFLNVVMAEDASFDRKYVDNEEDVRTFDWPHSESKSINVAFVTDPIFTPGEEDTVIGANVRNASAGTLQIALYDADGENLVRVIENGPNIPSWGTYLTMWDGTDLFGNPLPGGDYRIRWTFSINSFGDDGYREFPITLLGEHLVGDMTLDGAIDATDVAPFVLALTNPAAYEAQYGIDPALVGDINGDGAFDATDVAPFVELLVGAGATATVPEPGSLMLLAAGALVLARRRRRAEA